MRGQYRGSCATTAVVFPFVVLFFAAPSHAAIQISAAGVPTIGLPGFHTYAVTATSDVPGELIQGVDFTGGGSNDSATGRGFFGPLNQIGPPTIDTTYLDWLVPGPPPLGSPTIEDADSHFLVRSGAANIAHPAGFDEEGPNILQGIWAWTEPQGQSVAFAQLVIPNGATVNYRGIFAINKSGTVFDSSDVSGAIQSVPEPESLALIGLALSGLFSVVRWRKI